MTFTAVRLWSLNVWNGVVLTHPGQTDRMFVLVCACIWNCYWCWIQYEVVISPWCAVQIHYNGDDDYICVYVRCWLMLVECMERYRCRVRNGRTGSTFVLVWLEFETVISVRCNRGRNPILLCCTNTLQSLWPRVWMYGTLLCWTCTNRKYVCITLVSVWIRSCYWCSIQYEVVTYLTLMCCANALQWRWRLCVHVRWLYEINGVVFALGEQKVRLCWRAFKFEAFIGVRHIQYEITISPWCAVQMRYNVDDGCALMFREFTERRSALSLHGQHVVRFYWCVYFEHDIHVWSNPTIMMITHACAFIVCEMCATVLCTPRTRPTTYVCIGVCRSLNLWFMFDKLWGCNLTICGPNTFMFVDCMKRCHLDPGRTGSTFVIGVCVPELTLLFNARCNMRS